ncbi:MAG: helix-turn-helix transcriptional regulator [Clostridia bacterium]|nr:helix-turn-helix transcriptional regulator [Clostridia bacterium]
MSTSERIKELRMKTGISQSILAERVGVTTQTVSLWERGLRYPNDTALSKLSDCFNVHVEYLTCKSDDDSPRHDVNDAARILEIEADLEELAMIMTRLSKLSPTMRSVVAATVTEAYRLDKANNKLNANMGSYEVSIRSTYDVMNGKAPLVNYDFPKNMEP